MTERLAIPTIVSSDDPRDTLRAVLNTLAFCQTVVATMPPENASARAIIDEHRGRLSRLRNDVARQLDAESPDERTARQATYIDSAPVVVDTVRQMAQFVVDGWAPPAEIAGQVLALLAREVVVRA